ncbi:helix-turn-helix domain-containing protein [Streptomyces sp. SID8376]|uniref:helix-turn-helix domain-containing protein n=1 Tax=unclassified Streptomyces TaxID=2593676 RepID=UPI00035E3472|nr:helix-turn-helix domain-containing protein [Streptomyces sp. SID8376]
MTNYADEARKSVERSAEATSLDVRARAEDDEERGSLEHPYEYVDSESLASHNLKIIRKQLGVSQQQIAERLPHVYGGTVRLAQTQIAKIERGERPWRVNEMFAIAAALGVEWTELFRGGPKDPDENDDHLIMLGARNKYSEAARKAEEAKEAWVAAETEALKAGIEMAETAARLGIEDPTVMRFLEFRAGTFLFRETEEERMELHWETFDLEERSKEIQERGRRAWEHLLQEAELKRSEAAAEQEQEEEQ